MPSSTETPEAIKVLFALHAGMDAMDFVGPLEVLNLAQHDVNDPASKAFKCTFVSATEHTESAQGASFRAHLNYKEAYAQLPQYDILIIPAVHPTKSSKPNPNL
jgi:putative intracellular protease/amidase